MHVVCDVSQQGLNKRGAKLAFVDATILFSNFATGALSNWDVMWWYTSRVNGRQHDSLSKFKIWLKPSLRNYIHYILFLPFLSYFTKDTIRDVTDV